METIETINTEIEALLNDIEKLESKDKLTPAEQTKLERLNAKLIVLKSDLDKVTNVVDKTTVVRFNLTNVKLRGILNAYNADKLTSNEEVIVNCTFSPDLIIEDKKFNRKNLIVRFNAIEDDINTIVRAKCYSSKNPNALPHEQPEVYQMLMKLLEQVKLTGNKDRVSLSVCLGFMPKPAGVTEKTKCIVLRDIS
jgi:hypothetical protein